MPDDSNPTPTDPQPTPSDAPNDAPDDDGGNDLAGIKEALRKEREARRNLEREVKPLRTFKSERENAERTETERVAARVQEVEERERVLIARERRGNLRDGIAGALAAENFAHTFREGVTTDRVIRLLDLGDDDWDEDNQPKNVGRLLTNLQKSDPYLFAEKPRRTGSADGGATSTNDTTPGFGIDRLRAGYEAHTNRR